MPLSRNTLWAPLPLGTATTKPQVLNSLAQIIASPHPSGSRSGSSSTHPTQRLVYGAHFLAFSWSTATRQYAHGTQALAHPLRDRRRLSCSATRVWRLETLQSHQLPRCVVFVCWRSTRNSKIAHLCSTPCATTSSKCVQLMRALLASHPPLSLCPPRGRRCPLPLARAPLRRTSASPSCRTLRSGPGRSTSRGCAGPGARTGLLRTRRPAQTTPSRRVCEG